MKRLETYSNDGEKRQYFNLQKIESKQDVQQYLAPFFTNPHIGDSYCFRGVKDASFKLYSSLQRQWIEKDYSKYFRNIESYIKFQICQTRKDRWLMDKWSENNDYYILALIQHYAGRSALLDFSYKPQSSMFFAFDGMLPYRGDGSLNDYVSLYVINWNQPILAGVKEVYENGIKRLVNELVKTGIPPQQIDASSVLRNLKEQPYDKVFDGKIVHGGIRSILNMSIPFFNFSAQTCISNPNLAAQDGCFFQGGTNEIPFGELLRQQHQYVLTPIIDCFDINKTLKDCIVSTYKIDMDRTHTYPDFPDKTKLEKHVKNIDKRVWLRWALNGFKKL